MDSECRVYEHAVCIADAEPLERRGYGGQQRPDVYVNRVQRFLLKPCHHSLRGSLALKRPLRWGSWLLPYAPMSLMPIKSG